MWLKTGSLQSALLVNGMVLPFVLIAGYFATRVGPPSSTERRLARAWVIFRRFVCFTTALVVGLISAVGIGLAVKTRSLEAFWFGAFFVFYVCYDVYGAWWYTRFLLPAYPALLLGALLTARELYAALASKNRIAAWAAAAVLLVVPLGFEWHYARRFQVLEYGEGSFLHAESCRWADARLPANALILSGEMSGALKFYTGRSIVRWDYVTAEMWPHLEKQARQADYQFFAMLLPHELDRARQAVPGDWTEFGRLQNVSLWQIRATSN